MTAGPFVVAHRGASAVRAEHTLPAYERAVADGAHALECDVRLTRDGQVVCVHDRTVDRTSNGTGVVSEMSLAELAELDFASWHGDPAPAGVLTLDRLIEFTLDQREPLRLFIETKHPVRYGGRIEDAVLAALSRSGLTNPASPSHARAVVMSFAPSAMWRIRRKAPMLPTVLLGSTGSILGGGAAATVGATAIGPSVQALREDPLLVDRAAAAGRATYCWTVDDPDDMLLCRESGVSWMATNRPAEARRVLGDPGADPRPPRES